MIESCTRESLIRGYFPYGADPSIDTLHSPLLSSYRSDSTLFNSTSYSSVDITIGVAKEGNPFYLTDTKATLQQYLYFYPMLPRPPLPKPTQCVGSIGTTHASDTLEYEEEIILKHNKGFIHVPTSQRALLAYERAEEERREREMVNEAERLQLERQQKQIQQGRLDMKKYQSVSKHDDEDSDNDDDNVNKKSGVVSAVSNGITEEVLAERLVSVVSGVHSKSSTIVKEFNLSNVPIRIGGIMKLKKTVKIVNNINTFPRSSSIKFDMKSSNNNNNNSSSTGRPSLRPSVGLEGFLKRSPVLLSYSSTLMHTDFTKSSLSSVSASMLCQLTNKLQDHMLDMALYNFNISQDHSFYYEDHRYDCHRAVMANIHTFYSSSSDNIGLNDPHGTTAHHHVINKDISLSRLIRVKPNYQMPYIFGVGSYNNKKSRKKKVVVDQKENHNK